jgi:hypothetical protein
MYHSISIYGDAEGWNIAFYIFTACRSFLFFLVVILLATGGWVGGGGWVCVGVGECALMLCACVMMVRCAVCGGLLAAAQQPCPHHLTHDGAPLAPSGRSPHLQPPPPRPACPAGWSYMKPFIAPREKKLLMVFIPLQMLANIAIIYVDEFTPAAESWFT